LFWNVNGKNLTDHVCEIVQAHTADVIVLNECKVSIDETLRQLKSRVASSFLLPSSMSTDRFHCFIRNPVVDMTEIHLGFRASFRQLKLRSEVVVLGLVHGLDIRNNDAEIRQAALQSLADDMRFVQQEHKIAKLVMLGDFNVNPFDRGMNIAPGLNAMMTRQCVVNKTRRFQGKDYDFYYNPMWGLLGDLHDGPAGTIYDTSNQGPYGWNMLDQVIVHHALVESFESVQILTGAGSTSLVTPSGRPSTAVASDHLPLLVTFNGDDK
jgi:exonuclease III